MQIEMYFGYQNGNAKEWTTLHVDIPKSIYENDSEDHDMSIEYAEIEIQKYFRKHKIEVSFFGVQSIDMEQEEV